MNETKEESSSSSKERPECNVEEAPHATSGEKPKQVVEKEGKQIANTAKDASLPQSGARPMLSPSPPKTAERATPEIKTPDAVDIPLTIIHNGRSDITSATVINHTSSSSLPSVASPSSSSPPNFLQVTASTAPTASATSATSKLHAPLTSSRAAADHVTVKSEPQDDIKDYVETTMNELLGWYGLPKMDKSDTPQLTLGAYPTPASASATATSKTPKTHQSPNRPPSAANSAPPPTKGATPSSNNRNHPGPRRNRKNTPENKLPNDTNNNSSSCGGDDEEDDDDFDDVPDDDDDDIDDDDLCDENDELGDSISAGSDISGGGFVSPGLSGDGVPDSERGVAIICSWCQKEGTKLFTLGTPTGVKSFCSEVCFTQCRRASFKKNKVCDWCKHVRHTVNFVDFLDGDVQLQFCSEKCLNQYKMNIFCTEARQHLQHIQEMAGEDGKKLLGDGRSERREGEILITPELWLSGHTEDKVVVKEEVADTAEEKKNGNERVHTRSNGRLDDEEEPGEVREREREKARRAAALEMGVRAALSDDSNCSSEDRMMLKLASPSPSASGQRGDNIASALLTSKTDEIKNHSDLRYRRDRERIRKLLVDGKSGNAMSHGRESNIASSVKEKSDKHHSSHQRNQATASIKHSTPSTSDNATAATLLPNWATSQLLAMMPPHLSSSLAAANINSSLGGLGLATNPLLYSSLFGPGPLVVGASRESGGVSSLPKSRHESRRELLRDRDRSHEGDRGIHIRESSERSVPAVPPSPSTSHSSSDTPGPTSTPGVPPGMIPPTGLNPGFVSDFPRHLSHPLLPNDISQSMPLPHYFADPALAGMLHLQSAYNLTQAQRAVPPSLSTAPPMSSHLPSQHHPSTPAGPGPQSQASSSHSQPPPPVPPMSHPTGVPPVTVLVPYPVAVPIPIPVPIPLPITPEKLFAFFREKSEQAKATTSASTPRWASENNAEYFGRSSSEGRSRAPSTGRIVNSSPMLSPRPSSKCSSTGCPPYGSTSSVLDAAETSLALHSGRDSADSIMTLRREIGRSQSKAASTSPCSFGATLKRTITPTFHPSLDLSKRARLDCAPQHSEDEAIDLSKMSTRSESPQKSGNCSEKENHVLAKRLSQSDSDIETSSVPQNLKVPRIHIISEPPDPPLCQPPASIPLPVTPEQSSYSSRRSRILDAPSVPKKSRSPSPERRYVRTVPRDMVEAARRRGLRARVRSK